MELREGEREKQGGEDSPADGKVRIVPREG